MTGFFDGVHYLFAGFTLITKPGIKRFVLIPLIINIVLFSALFVVMKHYMAALDAWVLGFLPAWLQWLGAVIWLLFFLGFFFVFIYAFAALGAVVAAPFNGLLAEEVAIYLTGVTPDQRSLFAAVKDVPRVMARQFSIIFYYLPRALLILLLYFVPVIHVLAFFFWIVFSAWFLTLQYIDFPTDNQRVPLSKVRDWLGERRSVTLGFGFSLIFVMSIPVVNFFSITAAAAGATKFWVEENRIAKLAAARYQPT